MAAVLRDAVAKARGEGEALERGQFDGQRSAHVDTAAACVNPVPLEQRITGGLGEILRKGIEVVAVAGITVYQIRILVILGYHLRRELVDGTVICRSQGINRHHGMHHGAVCGRRHRPRLPLLERGVGCDPEPVKKTVVCIYLG